MPIPPDQLAAFAAGGGPPPGEDEMAGGAEEEVEEGAGQFGNLLTLLEANAEDVMALTDEFDPDQLGDPNQELDDTEKQELQEGVESLDDALKTELAKSVGGIPIDQALELANHLEAEGIVDDADRLGGWLFRVSQLDLSGGGEETDDSEDTEDEADTSPDVQAEDDAGGDY